MTRAHLLDLSVADVHVPSATRPKSRTMAKITTKKRNALPKSAFADPANRAYPVHDKAHADNAMARLEQQKGSMSPAKYASIKRRIRAAQRRFGESPAAKTKGTKGAKRGLRMTIDHPAHGRFEIRHMRDGSQCFRAAFPLDAAAVEGEGPTWVQIALPGHFEGHRAGPFDLNDRVFSEIIRNYRDVDNGEVAFDFEHASEADPTEGNIPTEGAPAQAWIKDLAVRAGNLYALVDWLEPARTYVRQKKYKYVSPAIRFNARHPMTGKPIGARLTSVAFTNQPFLRGLAPLAAKDTPMPESDDEVVEARDGAYAYSAHEYMPRIKAALKLHELATPTECSEHMDRLRDHLAAAGGDASASMQGVSLSDYLHPLRDLVCGGAMGMTWDEVLDVVEDLIQAAIDQHVADYHEAASSPDLADESDDEDDEEMTMSDKVQLTEAQSKLTATESKLTATEVKLSATEAKVTTIEAENSKLTLQLREAQGKATELETEVKSLRDWKAEREEKDLHGEVEAAFVTYKDKKNLKDEDKKHMIRHLKADPEGFRGMYPPVAPELRHLQRDLATEHRPPPAKVLEDGNPVTAMSTVDLANHLMSEEKLSYDEAVNKATRLKNQQRGRAA